MKTESMLVEEPRTEPDRNWHSQHLGSNRMLEWKCECQRSACLGSRPGSIITTYVAWSVT